MVAIALCTCMVLASAWMMRADSSALLMLTYLAALVLVMARALAATVACGTVTRRVLVAAAVGAAPMVWYLVNVIVEPMPSAQDHHYSELLGAVLPGIVVGLAVAMSINDSIQRLRHDDAARHIKQQRGMMLVNLVCIALVGAYLYANTGDDVLLVSVALLSGAETYQTLGDTLAVNLAVVTGLHLVSADLGRGTDQSERALQSETRILAGIGVMTLACGIVVGSNKLLLIALIFVVGHIRLVYRCSSLAARRTVFWALLALATTGIYLVNDGADEAPGLTEVLALTRLLDYGNVESLLDTPSIASRLEILSDCGGQQFALSPWFGDLAAEYKTCGDGHYLHSLLSVQTHLGVVGSVLVSTALAAGALSLWRRRPLRGLALSMVVIFAVGFVGAFFTWMPFWFMLALAIALGAVSSRYLQEPVARMRDAK